MLYIVGRRLERKNDHVVVGARDALAAALKAKRDRPEASITYVRRHNKRGDQRNPPQAG